MTRRPTLLTPRNLLGALSGCLIGLALIGQVSMWVGALAACFNAFNVAVTWFSAPTKEDQAAKDRVWLRDLNHDYARIRSVENRLDELERLKRREMVTPEEYATKRQEILKDL